MKTNIIGFVGFSILILFVLAVGFIVVKPVLAQVDATSTEQVSDVTTEPLVLGDSTSTLPVEEVTVEVSDSTDTTSASETVAEDTPTIDGSAAAIVPIEVAPEGLTKVRIIGTKYIDYFTDGTSELSFPGDPEIDAHLGEKDAPIPTHEGLTWVHTSGQHLYDTASGDLEEGQYALQSNGTYTSKSLPFVSSTSTPAVLDASTSTEPAPSDVSPDSSTTTSSTGTTTSLIFADDTVAPMAPTDTATTTIP